MQKSCRGYIIINDYNSYLGDSVIDYVIFLSQCKRFTFHVLYHVQMIIRKINGHIQDGHHLNKEKATFLHNVDRFC